MFIYLWTRYTKLNSFISLLYDGYYFKKSTILSEFLHLALDDGVNKYKRHLQLCLKKKEQIIVKNMKEPVIMKIIVTAVKILR